MTGVVLLVAALALAGCGSAGNDGAAGKDGTGCTGVDNGDGSNTITCADGREVTLTSGEDGIAKDGKDGRVGITHDACCLAREDMQVVVLYAQRTASLGRWTTCREPLGVGR